MSRAFDFEQFDLEIAIALGEVPENTQPENYTAYRPEASEMPLSEQNLSAINRLFGIKALGSTAFPPSFKPRS